MQHISQENYQTSSNTNNVNSAIFGQILCRQNDFW